MGRAPCCEKMGLKKGPWSPEEDRILINYILQHGHNNWRALPKQAGLLRCGKSCRLRWINYLRPDIKRGNFSHEEEETIIKLHEMLGNRWSAIAARLPGRTDNEIKNVWHTHLKKRLNNHPASSGSTSSTVVATLINAVVPARKRARKVKGEKKVPKQEDIKELSVCDEGTNNNVMATKAVVKNEPCTSEVSTVTSTSTSTRRTNESENDNCNQENVGGNDNNQDNLGEFPMISDEFWMEVLSIEDTAMSIDQELLSVSPGGPSTSDDDVMFETMNSDVLSKDMDVFWDNLLSKSLDLPELTL